MPDIELKRINALTEKTSLGDADMFAVDSASGTRKVSGETVKALIDEKIEAWAETGTVANANQLISKQGVVDHVPYFFRTSGGSKDIGDRKYEKLVGGSVGWNQLVNTGDTSVTVQNGHKYYSVISGTKSIGSSNGTAISVTGGTDIVIDLTLALGSTIADYLYTLEQATAGAGVAKLKSWGFCTKDYYAYDAGSMQSASASKMVTTGFNQWDGTKESGAINATTGVLTSSSARFSTDYIRVIGGATYYINCKRFNSETYGLAWYDSNKTYISGYAYDGSVADPVGEITAPNNAYYLRASCANSEESTFCINLSWSGYRNGEYEPYSKHEYALDSDLVLRGIPKLDDNHELYFDGDTYEDDGTVTRYWAERDYTSGDASDGSTMITNGTKTIYKLTTPTTETADPYTSPMVVDDFGTEEFVSTGVVPMGHDTTYPANLRDKVQHLPSPTGTAGIYAVQEDSHENLALTTLPASVAELPDAPTTDGNYVLKCAVSSGTATYSWVSEA